MIHSDVFDLKGIEAQGERKYFVTFINDYSKYAYVYLLKTKDEAFKEYKAKMENQTDKRIKELKPLRNGHRW